MSWISVQFSRVWDDLMNPEDIMSKDGLKHAVFDDFKFKRSLLSTDKLEVDFEPRDGSDILIKKVDPETALGHNVHDDEKAYFASLDQELSAPSLVDQYLNGGGNV